jgi:hypothetical protein
MDLISGGYNFDASIPAMSNLCAALYSSLATVTAREARGGGGGLCAALPKYNQLLEQLNY